MVEDKFDGNVCFVSIDDNGNVCLIMYFVLLCLHYISAYQVDDLPHVAMGFELGIEGGFII